MNSASTISSFIAELLLISAVALACKYVRLPYTLALVAVGLLVGLSRSIFELQVQLTPELLFVVLLPALLFEAAISLRWREIRENLKPILLLAIPGMLITAGLVGYGLNLALGLTLSASLIFGALISATDPISVLALFKQMRAPKALAVVVEGESLLNDGAAVVLFNLLLAGELSLGKGLALFTFEAGGGLMIGAALGWLVWRVNEHIDDHLIEITLSTILAYGSYLLAQQMHTSGVMAVIAAGLVYGNLAMERSMSVHTRLTLGHTWEYLGFLCNSLVFLLIGTQVDLTKLVAQAGPIVAAFVVVSLARAVALAVLAPFSGLPLRWQPVVFWAGLRGSIAMALGMALTIPEREQVLLLTFGVVLLSLFVQGLTIKPLLRWLAIIGPGDLHDYEVRLGELIAHEKALTILKARKARYHYSEEVFEELAGPLRERIATLQAELHSQGTEQGIRAEQARDARALMRSAQRLALRDALSQGIIGDEAYTQVRESLEE